VSGGPALGTQFDNGIILHDPNSGFHAVCRLTGPLTPAVDDLKAARQAPTQFFHRELTNPAPCAGDRAIVPSASCARGWVIGGYRFVGGNSTEPLQFVAGRSAPVTHPGPDPHGLSRRSRTHSWS
jgi:hypothetical protein